MKKITPIFRIFDEDKAKEFYVGFLEFRMDWEHRYEDDLPLYMQVSSGDCEIHLSGHHGDCTPGSAIRVEVEDIQSLHAKLIAKKYKHARPGLEDMEVSVTDPFGNRITFFERKDA
ncbi:glyoxalase superfamily protein [Paenibacillus cellulositrophicus]|uniref:glyoxalase superfamily protein n=1 Tax=Paenibacillus cellulositrophicus TaxID=562959 RepID=UPI003D954F34